MRIVFTPNSSSKGISLRLSLSSTARPRILTSATSSSMTCLVEEPLPCSNSLILASIAGISFAASSTPWFACFLQTSNSALWKESSSLVSCAASASRMPKMLLKIFFKNSKIPAGLEGDCSCSEGTPPRAGDCP